MSSHRSFLSLALAGEAAIGDIDNYVDAWHAHPGCLSLHEFLGLNKEEYALWVRSPDALPRIIAGRRLNRPLDIVAVDDR